MIKSILIVKGEREKVRLFRDFLKGLTTIELEGNVKLVHTQANKMYADKNTVRVLMHTTTLPTVQVERMAIHPSFKELDFTVYSKDYFTYTVHVFKEGEIQTEASITHASEKEVQVDLVKDKWWTNLASPELFFKENNKIFDKEEKIEY